MKSIIYWLQLETALNVIQNIFFFPICPVHFLNFFFSLANSVGYHDNGRRLAASNPIFLSDISALGGSSLLFIRLHAAFMLTAWIGTASIGILLARYYKQTWVGSQFCGKDEWFAVSRKSNLFLFLIIRRKY